MNYFDELTSQKTATSPLEELDEERSAAEPPQPVEQTETTSRSLKDSCQELLRLGLLEAVQKPNLFRIAVANIEGLNAILEPLDLMARVDDIRGLVYLVISRQIDADAGEDWSHPLIRKQRLTLEQSLLLALLRQHYVVHEQEAGVGVGDAKVVLDELLIPLQLYLGELGSDQREQNRLRTLLEQLKPHGVVSDINQHDEVTIRPIIVHLANPENLQALLLALKVSAQSTSLPPVTNIKQDTE